MTFVAHDQAVFERHQGGRAADPDWFGKVHIISQHRLVPGTELRVYLNTVDIVQEPLGGFKNRLLPSQFLHRSDMKRAAVFDLVLPQRDSGKSANRWLYESLRAEILEGRPRPGTRLPATRDLARQYGLARGTIVNAFGQLKSEGYVEGSVGSGTYVNKILPDELLDVRQRAPRRESTALPATGPVAKRTLAPGTTGSNSSS